MPFTNQYVTFLKPEYRISRGQVKPLNIYRISTYKDGDPPTKVGVESRYIFVIGIIGDKVHAIKLNEIAPINFTNFLFKLREKRVPIGKDQRLSLLLKHFAIDGKKLFEQHVRNESKIYGPGKNNYRIYKRSKIQNVWEIRFEDFFLKKLFKEESTPSTREPIIVDEIVDPDNDGNTINSPK